LKRSDIHRILVVALSNVGDVAVSAPVLVALKDYYPNAKLAVLVGPKAISVLESSPDIDQVILYDKYISWKAKWKLALQLRRQRFDIVIDLRNTAFPFISGAPLISSAIRWGEGRKGPMGDRHFKRLQFLGITQRPTRPFGFISDGDLGKAQSILSSLNLEPGAYVCLAPGARDSKKQWAPQLFGQLAKHLKEELGLSVLLLGSSGEKEILDEAYQASGKTAVLLESKLSFQNVMGLIFYSKIFCGNDSGLLHIAHEMQVRSVGIFGPTDPVESGYHDTLSRTIISPTKSPQDPRGGLDQISAEDVFEKCQVLLEPEGKVDISEIKSLPSFFLPEAPHILITRIDRIGDVLLTTPSFEVIKKTYPNSKLHVLVSPANRELVEGNPFVDQVWVYDKQGSEKSWWGTWRFARRLAEEKFDVCIHFHATNRVIWTSYLAGIPIRIAHRRKIKKLLTHSIEETKREGKKHESQYNLDLLKVLGIDWTLPLPPSHLPLKESSHKTLLQKIPDLEKKMYIILSPSASCVSKRWPADKFGQLGESFGMRLGHRVIIIGTEADKALCNEVLSFIEVPALNLAGKLTLGELGWLLKQSKLLISNDSGPVHMASALEVPVVSLFGRSDPGLSPRRWKPLGKNSAYIHKTISERDAAADFDYARPSPRLLQLEVEEVMKVAETLL